jgi:hypothetical protein
MVVKLATKGLLIMKMRRRVQIYVKANGIAICDVTIGGYDDFDRRSKIWHLAIGSFSDSPISEKMSFFEGQNEQNRTI